MDLEKLKEKLADILKEQQIIVTDVSFVVENKIKFLRIELDKVNGIDLDTIVEATNIINPIVDDYDVTNDSYILDVISKERKEIKYTQNNLLKL